MEMRDWGLIPNVFRKFREFLIWKRDFSLSMLFRVFSSAILFVMDLNLDAMNESLLPYSGPAPAATSERLLFAIPRQRSVLSLASSLESEDLS